MNKPTPAEKKLLAYIKKREHTLAQKEVHVLLNDIKRFVNLARRIYTEPQARVSYKDRKEGGRPVKDRIFTTDIKELAKVMGKTPEPIEKVMRRFNKSVTKDKYE